ncbi:hypothetical protein TURU_101699 [Turdus rufiventris]|nr:hypothetical protein TURU_101699 [Turdus rufiventris]
MIVLYKKIRNVMGYQKYTTTISVVEDETGKPYKYDCLAKDFENLETISEIEMKAIFEIPNVSYISQDCEEIPEFLGRKYGHMAKRLDLSFNLLR